MDRRLLIVLACVFLLALGLRVAFVLESAGSDYYSYLVLDSATYHKIAVKGDPAEPFWQPPLYPWFMRGIYSLAGGDSPLAVRMVQSLLGAISCVLLVLLVRRFGGFRPAAGAGFAAALTGPLIYFDGELLPASLAGALLLLLVLLLATPGRKGSWWARLRPPACGLLLGLLGLALPSLALVGLPLLVLFYRREGLRPLLALMVAAAIPIVPVSLRNQAQEEDLVAVSWNGGINFWIGNNAGFPESVGIRPGIEWGQLVERPRCEAGVDSRAGESRWFFRQGLRYIAEHPLDWASGQGRKILATTGGREIGRNREPYQARTESSVIWALLSPAGFPFLLIFPAAVAGGLALWRERRLEPMLVIVIVGVLAASVLFFPTARYRAPAIPMLLAVAALGLPILKRREWIAGMVMLGICLLPSGLPEIHPSETSYEIGLDLMQSGKPQQSLPYFERALASHPASADLFLMSGLALSRVGRVDEALERLETAVTLEPRAELGWQSLAMLRLRERDFEGARELFERAVEANPCNRRVRASYAQVLIDHGYLNTARAQLEEARRVYPRPDPAVEKAFERLEKVEQPRR